ncbi:BUB3-interacting and GLEBS motif-containing [Hyphodiscus hymeniophilus]|uniref:BUB3-interacting and GLEBS motif-containing n=1 Tax=Hyphodiscus hymeniophilus TaxID=353542 RepID=A0A9P6SNC0_9HELO|nr:BUB3-interacting and GLEBS motif-containing [Hyphodiscus hymeniophilus]
MVGKKKRGHPDVEELLARPWCYYCERDFDDLKILISHQKAKHFKCERCLSVHMNQVHKETLTMVDNSLPNRQGLEVEIFGMEGIPEDVAQAHNQRIIAGFYQAEAERRAATGNPGPGAVQGGGQTKKPKFESPSDLKKRLAEHKARKAEQAVTGTSSGGNTPMEGGNTLGSPMGQSPGAYNGSPYATPQAPYGGSQGAGYGSFTQEPYTQPAAAYQQPFQPPFSGPPGAQYQPQYSPPQQYNPQQSFPPGYNGQHFTAGSPPGSFNAYQPPPSHTPPAHGGLPNRPPSLPPAPGLPQRPSFGAPPVASYQMQQLHQGQPQQSGWAGNGWNGQNQSSAMSSVYPPHPQGYVAHSTNAAVDDLISGAKRETDDIDEIIRMAEAGIKPPKKGEVSSASMQAPPPGLPEAPLPVAAPPSLVPAGATYTTVEKTEPVEKKSKKEMRMVYEDLEVSPEERMALLPRYAFVPEAKTESAPASTQAVAVDA